MMDMVGVISAAIVAFVAVGMARVMWMDGARLPALGACVASAVMFYLCWQASGCTV